MSSDSTISAVGFCTYTGKGNFDTLEDALRTIAGLGANAAELSLYGEEIISGGRIIPGRAERLTAITRQFDLRYSVHGQIVSNFMDRERLEYQKAVVRAMLELCNRVEAGILVHHSGSAKMPAQSHIADLDRMERDALAEMAEVAKGYGVRIALENIFAVTDAEYRQTPAQVGETVRTIGSANVCGLIDFSHAYIESTRLGLDWREQIKAMAPVTGHLHVHDSFGRPYNNMTKFYHPAEATALGIGDLHLPIGWGDIPWEEIFEELTFLPDTMLIMEIVENRFANEQADCLERAFKLAEIANRRRLAA
ncbi:sugar phosphate isomerase/epimerase family protein [Phyllobacterium calauticae]|jgi:sugar phosphate isomerase/epimerase|uniref:sugar phosphate isomerase/epimerase family protein n=1 Tax=Phyllobacterium calauticae TaxID=2817027 RepID=UPI001CBFBC30|nr:sugar phosphate isomerase/epimerase [Phyllobacterium calauticae]MBZ3694023.1 sugar phosphate isomerase/epimerase [Phyllobacterium calauticae]|eukprot:gene6286-7831_t